MKKIILLSILLMPLAGFAQESRQDVSISADALSMPQTNGNGVQETATITGGGIISYRYMLTPHSALEANYSFAQNSQRYYTSTLANGRILTRNEEITGAYVYNMNFKQFIPFAEAGIGGMIFTPLAQAGTNQLNSRQNTNVGVLLGLGVAYELSPSWDVRMEYREFFTRAPNFNITGFKTNAYTLINMPAIGIAYHF